MDYYRSLNVNTLDPDIPTVFELLAARQLTNLINPYIRYILVHFAQSHPQYLLKIVGKFDELYLILFGLVEYSYLKQWNASFVEKFYGLKRVNRLPVPLARASQVTRAKTDQLRKLTRKQVLGAVGILVGVPYIMEKLQIQYEKLVSRYTFRPVEEDKPADNAPVLDHWRYQGSLALLKWYPRLKFVENIGELWLGVHYLFRGTGPFTISDWLLHTRYARINNDEDGDASQQISLVKRGLQGLGYVLPTTLFAIKALEWWNTSQFSEKMVYKGPDLPPPSQNFNTGRRNVTQECPICRKTEMETPSVLETGVVYCYKCIWDYLQNLDPQESPKCPASGIPLLLTEWDSKLNQWEIGGIRRLMI